MALLIGNITNHVLVTGGRAVLFFERLEIFSLSVLIFPAVCSRFDSLFIFFSYKFSFLPAIISSHGCLHVGCYHVFEGRTFISCKVVYSATVRNFYIFFRIKHWPPRCLVCLILLTEKISSQNDTVESAVFFESKPAMETVWTPGPYMQTINSLLHQLNVVSILKERVTNIQKHSLGLIRDINDGTSNNVSVSICGSGHDRGGS